jgi:hypothetical protein
MDLGDSLAGLWRRRWREHGIRKRMTVLGARRLASMPIGLAAALALHAGAPSSTPPAADAPAPLDAAAIATWRKFALNALLVPLLDDSSPLRWAPATDLTPCIETGSVSLDGKPLRAGERVPSDRFVLRWQLAHCAPLGEASFSLRGKLTMQIDMQPKRITALIASDDLVVITANGRRHPAAQPFTATLELE